MVFSHAEESELFHFTHSEDETTRLLLDATGFCRKIKSCSRHESVFQQLLPVFSGQRVFFYMSGSSDLCFYILKNH